MKDMKEHISMLESVSNCSTLSLGASVAPSPIPFNADDSYSHLGIKKNLSTEFSTPVTSRSVRSYSADYKVFIDVHFLFI